MPNVTASGDFWTLYSTGQLFINGDGGLWDAPEPWIDYASQITSVILQEGVTVTGNNAFVFNEYATYENLTSVYLPVSLEVVGAGAFGYLENLTDVYYSGTQDQWYDIYINLEGSIPFSNQTIRDYVTIHYNAAIPEEPPVASGDWWTLYHTGELLITLAGAMPDFDYDNNPAPWRSYANIITSAVIQTGAASVGAYAFAMCQNLTAVTLPASLQSIGDHAFYYCSSLTEISLPDSVTSIGNAAFYQCHSLTAAVIPSGVTAIGNNTFSVCRSLASVTIPDSVTVIGDNAFSHCISLERVSLSRNVAEIGTHAFYVCVSLSQIDVDPRNPQYSSHDGVLFHKNQTVLIQYPVGSANETYVIPDGVTAIGDGAFANSSNQSLQSLYIPLSVVSVSGDGLSVNVRDVYYGGTETQWNAIERNTVYYFVSDATIHYNSLSPVPPKYAAPVVNGFSLAGIVNYSSMQCEIVERTGANGGLLRDGTEVKDVLARKIRLSWTMNSISSVQYATLKIAVGAGSVVNATVFDPSCNATRTADFFVTLPPFAFAFTPPGFPPMSAAGQTITLEEA